MKTNTTNIPAGYKNSPLGIIPIDWEVKRLGEIGVLSSGMTPLRSVSKFYDNGEVNWVKTTDLNNSILYKTEEKVSEIAIKETSLKIHPKGSILIAMYGGFNQIGRTSILGVDAAINQALSCLTFSGDRYCGYYVLSFLNLFVDKWKQFAASSRKDPNITSQDVNDFLISLPPLSEQRRIAEIFTTWDEAIEKQNQKIKQLEQRKKGLMQQLLTGKKRLNGFTDKWKTVKLGEVLDYEQPTPYLVQSDNYNDSYVIPVLTAGKTFVLGYTNEAEGIYTQYPVIIFDDFTTDSKFVDFAFKAKSSAMKILKAQKDVNIRFVYESMKQIKYPIGGHERHWISKYSFLTIKVPSVEEQNAIASVIEGLDKEIRLEYSVLDNLQRQKKGLMQVLLTGKVRVK